MIRSGWALGLLACTAGLFPVVESALFTSLRRGLADGEAVRAADVIAVFGGGGGARIQRGMHLLSRGYAPEILFVGTGPEMGFAHSRSREHPAYSPRRIRFIDHPVTSTEASAAALVDWCRKEGVERVLVVSHAWHLGRVRTMLAAHGSLPFEPVLVPVWRPPEEEARERRWTLLREVAARGWFGLKGLVVGPPTLASAAD